MNNDLPNKVKTKELFRAQQFNADQTPTTGADIAGARGKALAILSVKAISGTSPTLAAKLQQSASPTFATTVTDVSGGGFTSIAGTASTYQELSINLEGLQRYIRVLLDVGGTSPVYQGCCILVYGGYNNNPV